MAQRVVVELTDDLDGSAADSTVEFSLDGKQYAIDLSATNAEKLRASLREFVAAARRPSGAPRGRRTPPVSAHPGENHAARTWLRDNGYPIKDRGRITDEHLEAYRTRTPADRPSPAAIQFKAAG